MNMEAIFCETKNGKGFKLCINDEWLYTSKDFLWKVIKGQAKSCKFRSIQEEQD